MSETKIKPIAYIYNDFTSKFGIPRQSGIANSVVSKIIFEPQFRNPDYIRGIDEYSHLWLLWKFSGVDQKEITPTVRPPKLGGNTRVGVFATRSPFRPNHIGLSSVKLIKTDLTKALGPVLYVSGADIMDKTPIIDIKPYLSYTDSHPDAKSGFAVTSDDLIGVEIPPEILEKIPAENRSGLIEILKQDPRPGYSNDPNKIYRFEFGNLSISFSVSQGLLIVHSAE